MLHTPRGLTHSNMHKPVVCIQNDIYGSNQRFKTLLGDLTDKRDEVEATLRNPLPSWQEALQLDVTQRPLVVLMINIVSTKFAMKHMDGALDDDDGMCRMGVPSGVALSCIFKFMNANCRVCHVHGSSHEELVSSPAPLGDV